ncbi:hypothetical protein [Agarivorans sp. Toyoura001]|nr:hypothetical protein [Agarivorans sp. Toyoura001]
MGYPYHQREETDQRSTQTNNPIVAFSALFKAQAKMKKKERP